jgi:assimilatory nitrate reductase catalytic subunit
VAGYKATLGADAPPAATTTSTTPTARCSSPAQHGLCAPGAVPPHRGGAAPTRPEADRGRPAPHRHRREADLHLAILPGTDVALFHAMLHVMLWEG